MATLQFSNGAELTSSLTAATDSGLPISGTAKIDNLTLSPYDLGQVQVLGATRGPADVTIRNNAGTYYVSPFFHTLSAFFSSETFTFGVHKVLPSTSSATLVGGTATVVGGVGETKNDPVIVNV